eukprot:TRINITY_DN12123_c0_g1_i1.p1 TRINITY_DN12123_c0_g1~~TRINITY_DN12123_c0_g1_i1.p1  ORF type:complete len:804 (+),score=231.06 TRINITY_DN12123_c0_g1_i1:194-2605(+)
MASVARGTAADSSRGFSQASSRSGAMNSTGGGGMTWTGSEIQFHHVASFVGNSLRGDDGAGGGPGERRKRAALPAASRSVPALVEDMRPPSAAEDDRIPMPMDSSLGLLDTSLVLKKSQSPTWSVPTGTQSDLPPLRMGRADKLSGHIGYLQAQQKAQMLQMKKLERMHSDSVLAAKRHLEQVEKNREQLDFYKKKCFKLNTDIESAKAELDDYNHRVATLPEHGNSPKNTQQRGLVFNVTSSTCGRTPKADRGVAAGRKQSLQGSDTLPFGAVSRGSTGFARKESVGAEPLSPTATLQELAEHLQAPTPPEADAEAPRILAATLDQASRRASQAGSIQDKPRDDADKRDEVDMESLTPRTLANYRRDRVRGEMLKFTGGDAKKCFRLIDLNGSGNISLGEFADGVKRCGVDWQTLTGMARPRDLFKLFDIDRDGYLDFQELFPEQARAMYANRKRPNTPEFWKIWCRSNPDSDFNARSPTWNPADPEDRKDIMDKDYKEAENTKERKGWISASFRRLKTKGKSDAKCREILCRHLPHGTGPKDKDGVSTFSQADAMQCKRHYSDKILVPAKEVQKVIYEIRDSRRTLQGYRQQFYTVAIEPIQKLHQADDLKKNLSSPFGGLGLGLGGGGGGGLGGGLGGGAAAGLGIGGLLSKSKSGAFPGVDGEDVEDTPEEPVPMQPQISKAESEKLDKQEVRSAPPKTIKQIQKMTGMDDVAFEKTNKAFLEQADRYELLTRKPFVKLLEGLAPRRTLVEADVEHWWGLIKNSNHSGDKHECQKPKLRKEQCNFEQFVMWWTNAELRS